MLLDKPSRLSLSLTLALLAVGILWVGFACGGETPTISVTPSTAVVAPSPTTTVNLTQATVDAYLGDVGELGVTMSAAENAAADLLSGDSMPAATADNIAKASEAASKAATAWDEWEGRSAPVSELSTLHKNMLTYLETMAAALGHLEKGVRSSDSNEYVLYGKLAEESYVAKKAAWAEAQRLNGQ